MYQRFYEKALPLLGVNRKIKKEWRMLPEMYQGLAFSNFPLIALAEKISFILGNWGFQGLAHSDAMAMAYKNFIIEVGLYDNPFMWSYADYGKLSLDATWFQNLWLLASTYEVTIIVRDKDLMQGIREHDRSLMSEFFRLGYQKNDLVYLNVVCGFQNLLHVSDIVKCNGCTIDEFATSEFLEVSIHHTFPREEPTPAYFRMWRDAIHRLCNGTTRLPYKLGHFLRQPHLPTMWFTDSTASRLFRSNTSTETKEYELYLRCKDGMRTRHGAQYLWSGTFPGEHGGTHHGSVTMTSNERAVLHSRTPICIPTSKYILFISTGKLWQSQPVG
jgi:hypothetical protein